MMPLSPSVAILRKTLFTRMPIFASFGSQMIWVVIWGPSSSLMMASTYGPGEANWSGAVWMTV